MSSVAPSLIPTPVSDVFSLDVCWFRLGFLRFVRLLLYPFVVQGDDMLIVDFVQFSALFLGSSDAPSRSIGIPIPLSPALAVIFHCMLHTNPVDAPPFPLRARQTLIASKIPSRSPTPAVPPLFSTSNDHSAVLCLLVCFFDVVTKVPNPPGLALTNFAEKHPPARITPTVLCNYCVVIMYFWLLHAFSPTQCPSPALFCPTFYNME